MTSFALPYLMVTIVGIASVNLIRLYTFDNSEFGVFELFGNCTLVLCAYPMWRYLRCQDRPIPFLPVLCLLYGLYFGLPAVLPFEAKGTLAQVGEEIKIKTLVMVVLGLTILIVTVHALPKRIWHGVLPQFSAGWAHSHVVPIAVALFVAAIPAKLSGMLELVPDTFVGLVNFLGGLMSLSCAMLLMLQLRNRLSGVGKVLLWGALIPTQIIVDLGSGLLGLTIQFGILLLMLFIAVKRFFPWRALAIILPIVFALHSVKDIYRAVTWGGPKGEVDFDFVEKGRLFLDLSVNAWSDADEEFVELGLARLIERVDYLAVMSRVVDMTPDHVPYWMGSSYMPLLLKPIPRFIFPDKPKEDHGQTFGHRYGILAFDDDRTSLNMAQLVEMYVNFGAIGVYAGMFLLGLIYTGLAHIFNHDRLGDLGIVSGVYIFSQLTVIDTNLSGLFGSLLYAIPAVYVLRVVLRPTAASTVIKGNIAQTA